MQEDEGSRRMKEVVVEEVEAEGAIGKANRKREKEEPVGRKEQREERRRRKERKRVESGSRTAGIGRKE
ncbi:hypothetical protein [Candidatus Accumulibacter sp. ACC003]|uniref:hypothetical protein n=1 Tax=Candidatus Accumulibacter sp. ACC003 TaxID=2823334 RepID=UPI0025C69B00|nr:hypothetical protein [Candidatus Accumulibacter sp. ACC003]